MLNRGSVGGVHLDWIVSTQPHTRELLVGKMLNHAQQPRIGAEQVLSEVSSALDQEFLVLPVGHFAQTAHQQAIAIVLNEVVPIAAPDDFDHVPSRATENGFEFLNDLAVATHRPVEAL